MDRCILRIVATGLMAVLLQAMPVGAHASDERGGTPALEASLLASGTIDIEPDGTVGGYSLDDAEHLPPAVREMAAAAVPGWRFNPVVQDGQASAVRARMHLRFVASRLADAPDKFQIRMDSATFPADHASSEAPRMRPMRNLGPIVSALTLVQAEGTVYVALRIDRNGRVVEATATRVNLRARGTEPQLRRIRDHYASAAEASARRLRYDVPTSGPYKDEPYWDGMLPFELCISDRCPNTPAWQWTTYVPGPRMTPTWDYQDDGGEHAGDAMPSNGFQLARGRLELATPLSGGG